MERANWLQRVQLQKLKKRPRAGSSPATQPRPAGTTLACGHYHESPRRSSLSAQRRHPDHTQNNARINRKVRPIHNPSVHRALQTSDHCLPCVPCRESVGRLIDQIMYVPVY